MSARSKPLAAIARQRLLRQGVADARFATPSDVVSWLLAVQAQDYASSLWAVGLRMRDGSEADVERAIADGTLVRTWPMRGTLHLVKADDVRWLLELLAPRVIERDAARIERDYGLDAAMLKRCRRVVSHALRDGKPMRRDMLYTVLDAAGIASSQMRGVHITGRLAMEGLICGGPRDGRQPTFVLVDAWAPHARSKPRDASLAELALRYFTSRGPATAQDLAWWSGLTVKDAQAAITLAGSGLVQETIDGKAYWHAPSTLPKGSGASAASLHLLPPFDEYLVGYRDRSAALDIEHNRTVIAINGLFNASIVVDGRIAGLWKRNVGKSAVELALQPFRPLPKSRLPALRAVAKRYGAFVGMPVEVD
jgi:hypothetical protein